MLASCLCLAVLLAATVARAQFAASVSPPRFDFDAPAGQTTRRVFELVHAGSSAGDYRFATADWSLGADGQVDFKEALQPGSCRPWVAIERRTAAVLGGTRLRFRFEVTPPPDTPAQECRFAIMIESAEQLTAAGALQFPTTGRIAVIVYARIGGAAPQLVIEQTLVERIDGQLVPALRVRNDGNATGRFTGFASARDADDGRFDLAPQSLPVLPGVVRVLGLMPLPPVDKPNAAPPVISRWPLRVQGTLEVEGRSPAVKLPLDAVFAQP
jgi:hypothetical protein